MKNELNREEKKKYVKNQISDFTTPNIEEIDTLMQAILSEMKWFLEIVDARIAELENEEQKSSLLFSQHPVPALPDNDSAYTQLVKQFDLSPAERLLLICSVMPHLAPEELTHRLRDGKTHMKVKYPEFGGYIDITFSHFSPTLQTILFLLSGSDRTNAVFYKLAVSQTGKLVSEGIINLSPINQINQQDGELNLAIKLTAEYLLYLQSGKRPRPDYGSAFPATWVSTKLDWEHLVLDDRTNQDIEEVMRWVEHGQTLMESNGMFNVSYPCLFYGPPGTGKSLTAKLIGKKYGKDVFRVDLSMIVSKYVGETEKNLAHLFDRAHGKDWILFFDEADSLFGKRTSVDSAQDKWANLEMSYMLQRMEEHRGLTILATNLKDNIDSAMTRRFQSIIYFPAPKEAERRKLWSTLLPLPFYYSETISFEKLASFELSGANIANILKDSCLCALAHKTHELSGEWLTRSIKKELIKEKKTP